MTDPTTQQLLAQSELFENVPPEALAKISSVCVRRTFTPNSLVFEQGAAASFIYLIVSGTIELRKRDALTGIELLLSLYGPGKSFGEEAVLTRAPYPYFAVNTEPAELIILKKAHFTQIMYSVPAVGAAAAAMIARRTTRLATDKGIRFINLTKVSIDPKVFLELPKSLVREHRVAPIVRRGRTLTLAMVNPHDLVAFDAVKRVVRGSYVEPVGVSEGDFERLYNKMMLPAYAKTDRDGSTQHGVLPRMRDVDHAIQYGEDQIEVSEDDRAGRVAGDQVVRLVNRIIGDGLKLDASDIHIEPAEQQLDVRYRIDGRLMRRADTFPIQTHSAVVSRIKALANMDITDRRRPQDGRLAARMVNRDVSLRISTVPTRLGEKMVIRILDRSTGLMSLDRIIDIPAVRELVRELVTRPHGIILVTGPTGSGKTTTMYSAILERKTEGINIVTVEDPIEYAIPGITQVQFNAGAGLDYAAAIRAFLRQDTDIMLIGETRDPPTAQNAMQAALSGHLVVTSLHTNSALASVYRLQEMGIERFLIANSVSGVVAQRLVRRVCQDCREAREFDKMTVRSIYGEGGDVPQLWQGKGCPQCNQTGYRGRVAAFEVLPFNEALAAAVAEGRPMGELKTIAQDAGMVTLREYCRYLLRRGLTTPQEVLRVLYAETEAVNEATVHCKTCGYVNAAENTYCEECGAGL